MTALATLTFDYAEVLAEDVLQFAKHAKRSTVTVDDVLLAARRNPSVQGLLAEKAKELGIESGPSTTKRKRKSKAQDSTAADPDEDVRELQDFIDS
eukprot:CAMPEP_0196575262 /NCGR_PEP_ID=MMETSP1081-20130531/4780_1 /TAXON_ID=36882 /ORGANISM="Pyramimonas amylifera, Strain CCMP720" /LENGTH=95 /DNA_ID=CAMNT_0041893517 /DNA_START=367 /DNA_END=654 /DNA_ORIENTATION=-